MNPSPQLTLDPRPETSIDQLLAEYEAAWHSALLKGGLPPDREALLARPGVDRERLAPLLEPIDEAYRRLRDLVFPPSERDGAITNQVAEAAVRFVNRL